MIDVDSQVGSPSPLVSTSAASVEIHDSLEEHLIGLNIVVQRVQGV